MIINCSECGKEISDKAISCVNCGCPVMVNQNQQAQTTEENAEEEPDRPEISTLKTVGTIVLVIGIISSVILLFVGVAETNWLGIWSGGGTLLTIIPVLLGSIVIWALLRTLGNTATDIKEIKANAKDE